MDKTTSTEIERLTEEYAGKIVEVMREHVRATFFSEGAAPVKSTPKALPPRAKKAPSSARPLSTRQRSYPPHCLAEGCKNAHGGPRMSFLCASHTHEFTKAQKKALLAEWKAAKKVSA